MDLHRALRHLVEEYGPTVLQNHEVFRGAIDDYLDEGAISAGESNLLVDAVRLGAVASMGTLLDGGAAPEHALEESASRLARDRGGADLAAARWACAVLGFALGRLPEGLADSVKPTFATGAAEPTIHVAERPAAPATMAAAPPEPTPERPQEVRSARRAPLVAATAVAVVLAVAVVVLLAPRMTGEEPSPSARSESSSPVEDVAANPRQPSKTKTVTVEPDVSANERPAFVCWDGTTTDRRAICGVPTGEAGAAWMFPESSSPSCQAEGMASRELHIECEVETSSGAVAYVKYSEWPTWDDAWDHYKEEQGVVGGLQDWLGLHLWLSRSGVEACCVYKAAVLYPGVPWSATVYAATDAERDQLLRDLEFREPGTLAGERRGNAR